MLRKTEVVEEVLIPVEATEKTNVLSLVSLFSSVAGFSLVGVVAGHIAMSQIGKNGEKGKWFAFAGLLLGYISIFFQFLFFILIATVMSGSMLLGAGGHHGMNNYHHNDYSHNYPQPVNPYPVYPYDLNNPSDGGIVPQDGNTYGDSSGPSQGSTDGNGDGSESDGPWNITPTE